MAAIKQCEIAEQSDFELKLYPLDEKEFVGSIWLDKDKEEISNSIPTFILLDSSNSMGDATSRFVNEIIPLVVSKLSYGKLYPIHLITFGKETTHHQLSAEGFKSLKLYTGNATRMAPAIQKLHSLVQSIIPNKPIRVLSISDGQIGDHDEAEMEAIDLIRFLNTSYFTINSQAVRLFTSESQPDTKALCCLLQINNTTTSKLLDVSVTDSNEMIATKIAKLFLPDNFSLCKILEMEKPILLKHPWDSKPSLQIILVPGLNIFWLNLKPTGAIRMGNKSIKVIMQDKLSLIKFQDLMETKLVYILDHMKILKVIGNDEANKNVDQMLKYFEDKESSLAQRCPTSSSKKISLLLDGVANDNNISNLDSARMAEYLRDTQIFRKSENVNLGSERSIDKVTHEDSRSDSDVHREVDELLELRRMQEAKGEIEEQKLKSKKEREDGCQIEGRQIFNKEVTQDRRKNCMTFVLTADSEADKNLDSCAEAKSGIDTNMVAVDEVIYTTQDLGDIRGMEENEGEPRGEESIESACRKHGETYNIQMGNTDSVQSTARNEDKQLKIYPLDESGFIGTIWIDEDEQISNSIQTVILLDRSYYMGSETRRFTNEIIPLVMSKLSYRQSQRVHFITFANYPQLEFVTAEEMKSLSSENFGRDRTRMATAIKYMHSYFQVSSHGSPQFNANKPVRVLVISAGGVEDFEDIDINSTALLEYLHASDFSVNAQAVRLMTSTSQPDMKALCSILQFNNMTTPRVLHIDAKESNETIATGIADVFQADNFDRSKILMMEEQIILKFPWNSKTSSQIILVPGLNSFWLKKIPTGDIWIRNKPVTMIMKQQLTLTKFQDLIEPKLPYIVDHIKILNVLGNAKANKTVDSIVKYFATKENDLAKLSNCSSVYKKISSLLADTAIGNNIKIVNSEWAMDDFDNRQKQSENVKNVSFPVILRQSENTDFPATLKNLRDSGENQSENSKYFDSPTTIKRIRDTYGKQTKSVKFFHSTPISKCLQDIGRRQSKSMENLDSLVVFKKLRQFGSQEVNVVNLENLRPSALVKKFEMMKNVDSSIDTSLRPVDGKHTENLENVNTPPTRNLEHMCGNSVNTMNLRNIGDNQPENEKQSENVKNTDSSPLIKGMSERLSESLENLVFSPIIESPQNVGKQSESTENYKSSAAAMKNVVPGNDSNMPKREYRQSKNVNIVTPTAIIENHLQDLDEKQSLNLKNVDPSHSKILQKEDETQSEVMSTNFSSLVKDDICERQPKNMKNLDSLLIAEDRKEVNGNQSDFVKNRKCSVLVEEVKDLREPQSKIMKSFDPSIDNHIRDEAYQRSENVNILSSPEIFKNHPLGLPEKDSDEKIFKSPAMVRTIEDVSSKQYKNRISLDSPRIVKRMQEMGGKQSVNLSKSNSAIRAKDFKDVDEKQLVHLKNVDASKVNVKNVQKGNGQHSEITQSEILNSPHFWSVAKGMQDIVDKQSENLESSALVTELKGLGEKKSEVVNVFDPENDKIIQDGTENVIIPTASAIGKSYQHDKQSGKVGDTNSAILTKSLHDVGEKQSANVKIGDPTNVQYLQYVCGQQSENLKIGNIPGVVENLDKEGEIRSEGSRSEIMKSPHLSSLVKDMKNLDSVVIVKNLKEVGSTPSQNIENLESSALAMEPQDLDQKQSGIMNIIDTAINSNTRGGAYALSEIVNIPTGTAIVKNHLQGVSDEKILDFPKVVENLQEESEQQTQDTQSKISNSQHFSSLVRGKQGILEKQSDLKVAAGMLSDNIANLETSALVDSTIVKSIRDVVDIQSDQNFSSPKSVESLREVNEKQSQNMKNVYSSAVIKDLQDSKKLSEKLESLVFSPIIESPRYVDKQSEKMENLKSSALAMRHVNQEESANDKTMRDGEYRQSENVNMVTPPAIVKTPLQDLHKKQSNEKNLDSLTIQGVSSNQFENMEGLDSPAILKNIHENGAKQSENIENSNSPIHARDFKGIVKKQLAIFKNIDPPTEFVESLQKGGEQQSEDTQSHMDNLESTGLVVELKGIVEKHPETLKNLNFSPIVDNLRDVVNQSENTEKLKLSTHMMDLRHSFHNLDPANDKNMRVGKYQKKDDDVTSPAIAINHLKDENILDPLNVAMKQSEYMKDRDNVSEKPSNNNKSASIVNSVGKQSQNVNQHSTEIDANVPDVGEDQSQCMERTDVPVIVKRYVDEMNIEDLKNLDLAEKGECRKEINKHQRVNVEQSESMTTLDSRDPQDTGQKQSGNLKNLYTPAISLREVNDPENEQNGSDIQSDSYKKLPSPAIIKNINEAEIVSSLVIDTSLQDEKQSDPANANTLRDVDDDGASGSELINYQPCSSSEIIDSAMVDNGYQQNALAMNLHSEVEKQSEYMKQFDSTTVSDVGTKNVTNLQVIGQKQSESMKNLEPPSAKKLFDVTYTLSENFDGLDASAIVRNLQDASDEQSKYIENIDLPVMVKRKYLENLKNLDLAEKGIAKNVSVNGEKQTKESTFRDISDIESGVYLVSASATQHLCESGNENNVSTAEKEAPRNRCGTFVIHSKTFDPLGKGVRYVGETNAHESDVEHVHQAQSETKNLLHPLMENNFELQVYPMDEYEFIGTITIEHDNSNSNSVETVIILDQSHSMLNATRRLTNEIIPLMLSKLAYDELQSVHLITYAMETLHYSVTAEEMKLLPIETHYGSNMAPCVQKVHSLLQSFDLKRPIRLLSISDGEIQDCHETENAVVALTEFLNASEFSINAQAVRLVTPDCQPDARALCTFLRINNTTSPQLVDIDVRECNETIANKIADLFQPDNFSRSKLLTLENEIILKFPWNSKPSSQIVLVPGLNVFWLNKIPTGEIKIASSLVNMTVQNPLTLSKFQDLMESKLVYIAVHMKILKIIDQTSAFVTVDLIVKYFETRETKLSKYSNVDSAGLMKISNILARIANDDSMKNFDSGTLTLYLRDAGIKQTKITDSSDQLVPAGIANDNKVRSVDAVRASLQQNVVLERSFFDGNVVKAEFIQETCKSKSKIKTNGFELQLYPMHENDFIATISIEEDKELNPVETLIILDQFDFRHDSIGRLTNEIIPLVLSKLSYEKSQPVHLLTFTEDNALHHFVTAEEIKSLNISGSHSSRKASAVQNVHSFFQSLNPNQKIRLLTVSGGKIQDYKETEEATKALAQFLDASNFFINSQSVRLYTKNGRKESQQEGGHALCSLLQINNTTKSQLLDIDVKETNETIATIISGLFLSDNFLKSTSLKMEEEIILKFPWVPKASSEIMLFPGLNVFWLNKVPTSKIKIRNSPVTVLLQRQLTLTKFQHLMEPRLGYIVDHIQMLKVVGTVDGLAKVHRILKYFQCTENELVQHSSIGKYRRHDAFSRKKISNLLSSIANDVGIVDYQRDIGEKLSGSIQNLDCVERAENLGGGSNTANRKSSNTRGGRTHRIWNFKFDSYYVYYTFLIIFLILVVLMLYKFLKEYF